MPIPTGQKARMLAGELYLAHDPELVAAHLHAQAVLARYNATAADAEVERREILSGLFGRLGEGTIVKPTLRCDYGSNIRIGDRSFLNFDCTLLDVNVITIGDEVLIAPNVQIYTAGHPTDAATRRARFEFGHPVTIGDGCWLGGGVIICPGVTIGENSVVGAGSVVVRDLPANVVAMGNPCRVVKWL